MQGLAMQNFNHYVNLSLVIFIATTMYSAESFVIPKKRRISSTKIKENIGQNFGEIVQKSADMITCQAHMQKRCIQKTKELLEQDPESFFVKATSQKLQETDAAVANLLEVIQDCQKKIQQAFSSVCRCME
jgi:hypothetical protein